MVKKDIHGAGYIIFQQQRIKDERVVRLIPDNVRAFNFTLQGGTDAARVE